MTHTLTAEQRHTPGCPETLVGLGYPCGRPVDVASGLGLCAAHSAERLAPAQEQRAAMRAKVAAHPPCACGEPKIEALGKCRRCYQRDRLRQRVATATTPLPRRACATCGKPRVYMGGQCAACWRETCHDRRRTRHACSPEEVRA